jgi:hypothetical protein
MTITSTLVLYRVVEDMTLDHPSVLENPDVAVLLG